MRKSYDTAQIRTTEWNRISRVSGMLLSIFAADRGGEMVDS